MIEQEIVRIVIGLRLGAVVLWGMLALWGGPSLFRVLSGWARRGDWIPASMALLGVGILIFQVRAFLAPAPASADYWLATALLSIDLSALGVFMTKAMRAPDGHKRAVMTAHVSILLLCVLAGMVP